ncbi:hypothetical protein HCN44_007666 [Aphidius gifuensis]|uniref:chymotrypsin n=1 Tax=Aphidius gifuensis TaxID=684658 RepID=A0A835CLE6_APHGI|nr:trypsin I-P1-like isoform X2 [Aphidius gifuensis]KAF7988172.1 hypothetical protein HCN44_007666 [Aphidius gifuensis]
MFKILLTILITFNLLITIINCDNNLTLRFERASQVYDENENTQEFENRIVGGEPTNVKTYPFIVSIFLRFTNFHHCGGSYILPRFVLTAAHCLVSKGYHWVAESPWAYVIFAGISDLHYTPRFQISNVEATYPHSGYNALTLVNDIALVKMHKPLQVSEYVNYAPLPIEPNENFYNESQICTVIGWGRTSTTEFIASDVLNHARVPLISSSECKKYYPHDFGNDQICAGRQEGGVDACQGDSGGPLVCNGILVGIVSWGRGCADRNSPGVYARVDYYLDWINETATINGGVSIYPNFFHLIFLYVFFFFIHY